MRQKIPAGQIARELVAFSAPLIMSGVLQQLYNWADAFIVGHVLGQLAMGAVGATVTCVNFFVTVMTGFTLGLNVYMAQRHGAGRDGELPLILRAFCPHTRRGLPGGRRARLCLRRAAARAAGHHAQHAALSTQYLSVIFLGMPFLAVYNVYSAALRAVGDSRAPFLAVCVSSLVNVALDLLLVAVIPLGVRGAAIATVASQAAMTVFIVLYAVRKRPELRFKLFSRAPGRPVVRTGFAFGLPPMVQSSIGALGSLILQSYMNGFGDATVTAITTAYRVDTIILLPIINLGSAISTLTAQSHGAGDSARAGRILSVGCAVMSAVALALTAAVIPAGGHLIAMFGAEGDVVAIGADFFRCIAPYYAVYGLAMCVRGYIEGLGDMFCSSGVGIAALALRIGLSYALTGIFWNMTIAYAEAFCWVLMLALYLLRLAALRRRAKG